MLKYNTMQIIKNIIQNYQYKQMQNVKCLRYPTYLFSELILGSCNVISSFSIIRGLKLNFVS